MYILRVKDHFDAAHFLPWHEGKCKNLHGHRWEVEVVIEAEDLDENGIVIDFGRIKEVLEFFLPDHQNLNDILPNPTAELIAEHVYEHIKYEISYAVTENYIPNTIILKEVTVWESPNCSVTYRPEET